MWNKFLISFSISVSCFVICCIYILQKSSPSLYEFHVLSLETVINRYLKYIFLFCGDYNLSEISWYNDENGLLYYFPSAPYASCIPEILAANNFLPINSVFSCNCDQLYFNFVNILFTLGLYSAENIFFDALH